MGRVPRRLRRIGFQKGQHKGQYIWNDTDSLWTDKDGKHKREHITRVEEDDYCEIYMATSGGNQLSGPGGKTDYTTLRPKATVNYLDQYSKSGANNNEYLIMHKEKTADLWNNSYKCHHKEHPLCKGSLVYNETGCKKWGTVWKIQLKCTNCSFVSGQEKLYNEVQQNTRGRKAADINVRLALGTSTQGIGPSGTRHILSSMNIQPPAASSMQNTANKVSEQVVKANKKDMKMIRNRLKDKNEMLGRPRCVIDAEGDGRYNNSWASGWGRTPTQPATQCSYIMCENVTPSKKIVAVGTWSRLCTCDVGPANGPHTQYCPADMASNAVMGNEALYLSECLGELNEDDITVEYLTIDGDAKCRKVVQMLSQPDPTVELRVLYCSKHLNRILQKAINNATFSGYMFVGRTKADRQLVQKLFSHDVQQRLQAEMETAIKLNYDVYRLINFASYLYDCVYYCYQGNCRECRQHSLVCTDEKVWHQPMLKTSDICNQSNAVIKPRNNDYEKLREVLNIRLSRQAVLSTFKNTTQNKCEATNRGISKTSPKHMQFKRNFPGRVHAEVNAVNNGPGASLVQLADALNAPFDPQSPVIASLKKTDKRRQYQQKRYKTQEFKSRRAALRKQNYVSALKRKQESGYVKASDVMEHIYGTTHEPHANADHTYCKRTLRKRPARPTR